MMDRVRTASGEELPELASIAVPRPFEEFYVSTHRELFASMWLITRNPDEAEEIAQDAYLRLLERWDHVSRLHDPVGYLYRTATNVWRSRARRAAVAIRKLTHLGPTDADEIGQAESRLDVVRALAALTPRQRAALVLTDLIGFSSEEAAGALGVRPSTVRVLAGRGRTTLKEVMKP
jgi:RNA polymerase sigma-70 factor (ECF subfamily)